MSKRKSKRKKDRPSGDVFFKIILIICSLSLCLSYLSIFIDPAKFWLPMFFGLYYIPICTINLILLIVAAFRRKQSLLIPLIALLPSLFFADLFVKLGREEKSYKTDGNKVITYNVGRFRVGVKGETSQQTTAHIVDFLNEEDPAIICLQEVSVVDTNSIIKYFHKYPYHSHYYFKGRNYFGNLTLSKYPIIGSGTIRFDKSTNLCIWSDIKTTSGIVRVYNCHLESYSISFTALIKRFSKKGHFTDEFLKFHHKLRGTTKRRSSQVDILMQSVEESDYASIICGDFNDTPLSYTYHTLKSGHKDSFVEGGVGFSSTYSVLWPLLRIDYILAPEQYFIGKHRVTRIPFSDHYPVGSTLYLE